VYGFSASGKSIKSGWMFLCVNETTRSKQTGFPIPPLETTFENPTPENSKAFNASSQDWFAVNTSSTRSSMPDYFNFTDVLIGQSAFGSCNPTFSRYVNETALSSVMQGFPNNTPNVYNDKLVELFACSLNVSRADATVFLVRALNLTVNAAGGPHFTDVPPTHPAYAAVETLYNAGITGGCTSSEYCPSVLVSRAALVTMLVRGLKLPLINPSTPTFVDVPPTHWAFQFVETAVANGIATGVNATHFEPDVPAKREQAAVMVYNALESLE